MRKKISLIIFVLLVFLVFATMVQAATKLSSPVITTHEDREEVNWDEIDSELVIRWKSVSNADGYYYAIKLLDGQPSSGENESGTMLLHNPDYSGTRVRIDKDDLLPNHWVKIYVVALGSGNY